MAALTIGNLTLGDLGVPARTPINRSRTRLVLLEPGYNFETTPAVWDFGDTGGFRHVFQSQEGVGHLTADEMRTLQALEATKAAFTLTTDLFGTDGETETFTAYFDPENKAVYQPAVPDGSYYLFQAPMYLIKQAV